MQKIKVQEKSCAYFISKSKKIYQKYIKNKKQKEEKYEKTELWKKSDAGGRMVFSFWKFYTVTHNGFFICFVSDDVKRGFSGIAKRIRRRS
jgi:hypothetical protein